MALEDILYSVGATFESASRKVAGWIRDVISPSKRGEPPSFSFLRKFLKRDLTPHEFLSLELQLVLLSYLLLSLFVTVFWGSIVYLSLLFIAEFLSVRYILLKNWDFLIDPEPYRFFYYWLSAIAFLSFLGYLILKRFSPTVYYYYAYLTAALISVLLFRHYFKSRYGRDYTYGVVEEVKNDLVRVFVHDDIAANVKPGYYWLPAVPDARPGRVVKILVEEKVLKSARPSRIIEVYLDQSSQTETEPKEAAA